MALCLQVALLDRLFVWSFVPFSDLLNHLLLIKAHFKKCVFFDEGKRYERYNEHKSRKMLMNDEKELRKLYEDMYQAMINKDEAALDAIHDEGFVLVHMTGMHQDKETYIRAILDGTLNYKAQTKHRTITVDGENATVTRQSLVEAVIFGGGKHTWCLQRQLTAKKKVRRWQFTKAEASTW
jgi:ketosteroid isomerase-like protein